jgi:hypothetical protein
MGFELPIRDLQPLDWKDAGEKVIWARMHASYLPMEASLQAVAFADWIEFRKNPGRLADTLKGVQRVPLGADEYPSFLGSILYLWAAHFAFRQGWRIQSLPGQPVLWHQGDQVFDFQPFIADFAMDIRNETDWMALEAVLTGKTTVSEFDTQVMSRLESVAKS